MINRVLLMAALSLLAGSVRAADATGPDCLVFNAAPIKDGLVTGTLVNKCGKGITAYKFRTTGMYDSGKVLTTEGGGADNLVGAAASMMAGQSVPGTGAIQPNEERKIGGFGVSGGPDGAIREATVKVACVVFDDATAVGDDGLIQQIFARRTDELREFRFWRQMLSSLKSKLSTSDPLTKVVDLANVSARERQLAVPNRSNNVRFHGDLMRKQLGIFDSMVTSGQMSRENAIKVTESLLNAYVVSFEKNSTRRQE